MNPPDYGRGMDEAHRVIARLERIECLRRDGSAPSELLEEVRCLLREGELWLERERAGGGLDGTGRAWEAIRNCRERIWRAESQQKAVPRVSR